MVIRHSLSPVVVGWAAAGRFIWTIESGTIERPPVRRIRRQ